jgi:hypothetical protein
MSCGTTATGQHAHSESRALRIAADWHIACKLPDAFGWMLAIEVDRPRMPASLQTWLRAAEEQAENLERVGARRETRVGPPAETRWRPDAGTSSNGSAEKVMSGAAVKAAAG